MKDEFIYLFFVFFKMSNSYFLFITCVRILWGDPKPHNERNIEIKTTNFR